MSKKTNTLLFILAATVFNILVTIAAFLALLFLFTLVIMQRLPENTTAWAIPVIFIGAIVVSFVIYRAVLKFFMKKVDIDKHFDPIFGSRRPPVRRD
jgi:hypothetical protein